MTDFAKKLIGAREKAGISMIELGERVGVSRRSIYAYESGASLPRKEMLRRLAKALDVTVEYLTTDDCDDPEQGRVREEHVEAARELFGSKGAKEAEELLSRNLAFMAGGSVDQESKDAFFEALMTAYVTCKNEARAKFGRKKPEVPVE